MPGVYWPPQAPDVFTIGSLTAVFEGLGYTVCDGPGMEPGFEKVAIYVDARGQPTHAARQLHLSVRAVTYRLSRVQALTGYDPANPADWFTLHAAVLGARLLGWPRRELPRPS